MYTLLHGVFVFSSDLQQKSGRSHYNIMKVNICFSLRRGNNALYHVKENRLR